MSRDQTANRVRRVRRVLVGLMLTTSTLACVRVASAQDAPEPAAGTGEATVETTGAGLPFFLTLGAAYGLRIDGCSQCPTPVTSRSFTGHLSVGKYLVDKLAIGLDGSVWRRAQPGGALGSDTVAVATPTKLVSHVGNASLVVSYQRWHVFVRGGLGIAFAQQDVQEDAGAVKASGWGVGYTAGLGATLPLMSMVSLAFFANYNTGWYDLMAPSAVLEQSARHSYIETGFGLTIR